MTDARALNARFADVGGVVGIFGSKASDYANSRPGYPDALYAHLEQQFGASGELTIADVGAGTGLLARGLVGRGHRVIAVEPNAAMRREADALLGAQPRYRSVAGRAEDTGLAEASVDLVTAAQAFHWFDAAAFRMECLRILRPHGLVALIWNDRDDDPLNTALTALFVEFGGAKRAAMVARNVDDETIEQFFGRGPMQAWSAPHVQVLDAAGLQALAFSRSFMPRLDTEAGTAAAGLLQNVFQDNAVKGRVQIRYITRAFIGRPW